MEAGLELGAAFIMGFPGETEKEIQQTIELMHSLPTNSKGFSSFIPMPGSPFSYEFITSGRLERKQIDWSVMGDISAIPKASYAEVGLKRLQELSRMGRQLTYGK